MRQLAILTYHLLELLGGEKTKGIGLLPYKRTQRLKLEVLMYI